MWPCIAGPSAAIFIPYWLFRSFPSLTSASQEIIHCHILTSVSILFRLLLNTVPLDHKSCGCSIVNYNNHQIFSYLPFWNPVSLPSLLVYGTSGGLLSYLNQYTASYSSSIANVYSAVFACFSAAKPLYPQEIVYINKRCCLGPLLSRDLMRSLPDAVRGSVVGPEKHNIMRLCMQHLVSASINPKQVLELFSREFYQSKKNRYKV